MSCRTELRRSTVACVRQELRVIGERVCVHHISKVSVEKMHGHNLTLRVGELWMMLEDQRQQ